MADKKSSQDKKIPTKDDIVRAPRDIIVDGKILNTEVTTWREYLNDEEKIKKFDNPDSNIVVVQYEDTENNYKGTHTFNYYEKPTDNSALGKAISKYGGLDKGTEVKVIYDSEGFSKIHY